MTESPILTSLDDEWVLTVTFSRPSRPSSP